MLSDMIRRFVKIFLHVQHYYLCALLYNGNLRTVPYIVIYYRCFNIIIFVTHITSQQAYKKFPTNLYVQDDNIEMIYIRVCRI